MFSLTNYWKILSSHQLHSLTLYFFSYKSFFAILLEHLKENVCPQRGRPVLYLKSSLKKSQQREKDEIPMNEKNDTKRQKVYGDHNKVI